jgi:FkbM family methyltransferase
LSLKTNTGKKAVFLSAAVGAPDVENEYRPFTQTNTLASALDEVVGYRRTKKSIEVPVVSLSSIVNDHAKDGYSLISDAEGAEIMILKEDPDSLKSCRQIAIELHGPNITGRTETTDDLIRAIEKLGFERRASVADTHYFLRHGL